MSKSIFIQPEKSRNMNFRYIAILSTFIILFSFQHTAYTQSTTGIEGPTNVCLGDCAVYSIDSAFQEVFWETGNGLTLTGNPVTVCFDQPGAYVIQAYAFDAAGNEIIYEMTVLVEFGTTFLEIYSNADLACPGYEPNPDDPEACEKVCAGSTVTYQVEASGDVEWSIIGADNFDINGNTAVVEWGTAGTGEVYASSGNSNTGIPPLTLNCGQQNASGGITGFGEAWFWVDGGTPPFTYSLNGSAIGNISGSNPGTISTLQEGTYILTVVDANGNSADCAFTIIGLDISQCFATTTVEFIQQVSECDICDGSIFPIIDVINNGPLTYQWSTGETSQSISNLCPGNYFLTVTDGVGCQYTQNYVISAPDCGGCGIAEASLCVEILEEPNADFTTIPGAINGVVEICEDQTVYFTNTSSGADQFIWDFGDLTTSDNLNPEHTYEDAGTYTVSLIARNECYCADTTEITVNVINAEKPAIECVGTVCEGESVTYSAASGCGTYNWNITGSGIITAGGGVNDDFVTVEWLSGPVGTVELAVGGCGGNVCSAPNIEIIPILSDNAVIDGPNQVCDGDESIYEIPKYDGTNYVWTTSSFGTITSGQNTNRITVKWEGNVPNTAQWVDVVYENCWLECGGDDHLVVSMLPEYYIVSAPEGCQNEEYNFLGQNAETGGAASLNWTITAPDGSTVFTSAGAQMFIDYTFTGFGRYTISTTPGLATDWCTESYTSYIEIREAPPAVGSIAGETNICPGEPYTYTATTTIPAADFVWVVNDGGTTAELTGNPINYTWSSTPPYEISVAQINTAGLNCQSAFISQSVNQIPSITVAGEDDVCLEETMTYTATDLVGVDYEWVILPEGAGSIADGEGTNSIDVFWTTAGNNSVQLTVCGSVETQPVLVRPKPMPVVNHPTHLCPGETTIVSTTAVYSGYQWQNENQITISTDPTPELAAGYYNLLVTNDFGCTNNIKFEIIAHPTPSVFISSPDHNGVCLAGGETYPTLYAEDTEDGYSYQWYQGNVAVGIDDPVYTTTAFAEYYVVVTDQNGCNATSNIAVVYPHCDDDNNGTGGGQCSGGGGGGNPLPECADGVDISYTYNTTPQCNTIQFQNTSPAWQMGSLQWVFDDGSISLQENPSHTFVRAGYFNVILYGSAEVSPGVYDGCYDEQVISIPLAANFEGQRGCPGELIEFTDLSTKLPNTNIAGWEWDFGDGSATSNLQHPTHSYSAPGFYNAILTVTAQSGCTATIAQSIEIFNPPTVSFTDPIVNCAATALEFIANISTDVTDVEWNFGDPASGDANISEAPISYHTYNTPGSYNVTITATSIYGCETTFTMPVTVEPNNLAGDIAVAPSNTLCAGDVATLTASPNGVAWEWSTGETTENITVGESGVYEVTVTDDNGCTFSPTGAVIDVLPLPEGDVYAIEYNEFGQPISYTFELYETCEGEDVFLEVEETAGYGYEWSSGSNTTSEEFSEARGNQLTTGTYDIAVTITNEETGCINVSNFQVIVHGVPTINIASTPGGTLCENSNATLNVTNVMPNVDYVWNTGEIGTSITVVAGGDYWVIGTNEFGCEGESNHIEVNNAPDIDKIPDGCHTRCGPDTICLPTLPTVISYQWYFNGIAIPAPEGTVANLIAENSGEYFVIMNDMFGCSATSDVLTLDLYDGFGTFDGEVYMDVNENGIIDAGDTLVNNVNINIFDQFGAQQGTATTNIDGAYFFSNILSTDYTMELDTLSLPEMSTYTIWQVDTELVGCDAMATVNWLITPFCPEGSSSLQLISCDGSAVDYDGTPLLPGETQDFNYLSVNGCDSIVSVSVIDGFTPTENLSFNVCEGETYTFDNMELQAGDQQLFSYVNQYGCDSLIEVSITELSASSFDATAENACWNSNSGSIEVTNMTGGNFQYSLDGVTWQDETTFTDLAAGNYTIAMLDDNNCETELDIDVPQVAPLVVQFEDKIFPCAAETVELEAFPSANSTDLTYLWQTGETTPTATITEPGSYWVEVTNECETLQATTEVAREFHGLTNFIYMPNAFSPNDDGMNDKFKAEPAASVEVLAYQLMVFDRWGNMLYQNEDVFDGWDGMFRGKNTQPNVYVWMVKTKLSVCGEIMDLELHGDVTLTR